MQLFFKYIHYHGFFSFSLFFPLSSFPFVLNLPFFSDGEPCPIDARSCDTNPTKVDDNGVIANESCNSDSEELSEEYVLDLLAMEDGSDIEEKATAGIPQSVVPPGEVSGSEEPPGQVSACEVTSGKVPSDEVPPGEATRCEVPQSEAPSGFEPSSEGLREIPAFIVPPTPPISVERSLETINAFRPAVPLSLSVPPSFSVPPPSVPDHYGSILFPRLDPFISCPSTCLAEISHNYRSLEKEAFDNSRTEATFPQFYGTRRHNRPFCRICSEFKEDPTPIWHRHYSTKAARFEASPDIYGRYSCSQCAKSPHYYLTGGRSSVLLTASTLNDFWGMSSGVPYIGDSLHCDSLSIPGGRVADLTRAFKAEFSGHPVPVDAICVLGYNDILNPPCLREFLDGEVEELLYYIRRDMSLASKHLKRDARLLMQAVLDSSPPHQYNSCAFVTLPVPPLLAWKNRNNTTSARAGNICRGLKIEMLNTFNQDIRAINKEVFTVTQIETTRAPSFKSWGMKRKAPNTTTPSNNQRFDLALLEAAMGPFANRLGHFRESNLQDKLHFSPYQKLKMGRACLRYFKNLYKLEDSEGDSKEEGVARLAALNSRPQAGIPDRDRGIFTDPSYDRCATKDLPLASTQV